MSDRFKKHYHHDYYFGPAGMTERNDWRQADFDPRNQVPEDFDEEVSSHEPIHVSDDEIYAKISELLTQDPEIDTSEIEMSVHGGAVKVSGTVPTRWMKQKVLSDIAAVFGVSSVENKLHVDRPANREAA